MTYIPDCRKKLNDDGTPNPYWEGVLIGEDKEFIRGYDYNTDNAINNLFDNLDVYTSEFAEENIDINDVDINIVCSDNDEKWYVDYTLEELEQMNKPTRLMLLMKYILNHYIEMERDELITAMIDDMEEE